VTIVDANILIYAYNPKAPHHEAAAAWLEALFDGSDLIGLPWLVIWAFLRISTNTQLGAPTSAVASAFQRVGEWLAHPKIVLLQPGSRHLELLERLVTDGQANGPLLSDAALAALALENGATLASTDRDLSRFPNLRWINPLP
jgi:uncharacterized protein